MTGKVQFYKIAVISTNSLRHKKAWSAFQLYSEIRFWGIKIIKVLPSHEVVPPGGAAEAACAGPDVKSG